MSVNFDSTFGFDPAVQDSSMAARGLYATMVTWCDHQIYTRPDSFEESAPDYPDPDDDADETDRGEAVDPTTGEIK